MFRRFAVLTMVLVLVSSGCSLLDTDDSQLNDGIVSLRLIKGTGQVFDGRKGPQPQLAAALDTADSIAVKVFRQGTPVVLERAKGASIPPSADTVSVSVTVDAGDNKRVSVELFENGKITFFGVDDDVDIQPDIDTFVQIAVASFEVSNLSMNVSSAGEGFPFSLLWGSLADADGYQIEMSSDPGFSVVDWDTVVTSLFLSFAASRVAAGDYWFRLAAVNPYAASDYSDPLHVHVYGPPQVSSFSPPEVLRVVDEITIVGSDLNYPGGQVTINGLGCTVSYAAEETLKVVVPAKGMTGPLKVSNDVGTGYAASDLVVQNIAYIFGLPQTGDWDSASEYKAMIDGYRSISKSAVVALPYTFIDLLNMAYFDLFIIGWDSGDDTEWASGVKSRSDAIAASGAMVLGIGAGGAAYFESRGLDIGIGNTTTYNQNEVWVGQPNSAIYTVPNRVTVPADGLVDVYTSLPEQYGTSVSGNTTAFASRAQLMLVFPLAEQEVSSGPNTITNLLWGFGGAPKTLTVDGNAIFENVVNYLYEKTRGGIVQPN